MTHIIAQNQQGSVLPITIPFDVPISGDLTLGFSGTCWSFLNGAICGFAVYLDDKHIGDVPLMFNNANQHLPLPPAFFPINIDFGPHTIRLSAITDTTRMDQNDYFSLWIVD